MKSSLIVSEESRGGMAVGKFQEGGLQGLKGHCGPVLVGSGPQWEWGHLQTASERFSAL